MKNNIPFGVVVYGDLSNNDYIEGKNPGEEHAKEVIKAMEGYNVTLPVILKLDDQFDHSNLYTKMKPGLYFVNAEEFDPNSYEVMLSREYCTSFMKTIKKAGYQPMLCTDDNVYYSSIKDYDLDSFDKIVYKQGSLIDPIGCDISMRSIKYVPGISGFPYCTIYVDNASFVNDNEKVNKKK